MRTTATFAIALLFVGSDLYAGDSGDQPYLCFDGGVALLDDVEIRSRRAGTLNVSFDPGFRFDARLGFGGDDLAVELEVGLIHNSIRRIGDVTLDSVDADSGFYQFPLMVNLLYNYTLQEPVFFYAGLGIGGVVSYLESSISGQTSDSFDAAFGLQGMLGFKYRFPTEWEIALGYKPLATFQANDALGSETGGTLTHAFVVAMTYNF